MGKYNLKMGCINEMACYQIGTDKQRIDQHSQVYIGRYGGTIREIPLFPLLSYPPNKQRSKRQRDQHEVVNEIVIGYLPSSNSA